LILLLEITAGKETFTWFKNVILVFDDFDPDSATIRYGNSGVVSCRIGDNSEFWILGVHIKVLGMMGCVPLLAYRAVVVPPSRRPQTAGGTPAPQECYDTSEAYQEIVMHPSVRPHLTTMPNRSTEYRKSRILEKRSLNRAFTALSHPSH
jgi:hypothetical protein